MFKVVWMPDATQELEAIWQRLGDTDAILLAMWAIERQLKIDPSEAGESREDDLRVAFAKPLAVHFHVDVEHEEAIIGTVWSFK